MQLRGFHHLTAVTANARDNLAFYTKTLGMRLVKRTVNQDDVSAYHLFYGDGHASPGSDITFFDWPAQRERRGTNSVVRTGFRIDNADALVWWQKRFAENGVTQLLPVERNNRLTLDFEDFEGQRLSLIVDEAPGAASPWGGSPVPAEHQIRGLGCITLSVAKFDTTDAVLTTIMNMRRASGYSEKKQAVRVFEMADGGPSAELHVIEEPDSHAHYPGAGGVHHVAFRTPDNKEYDVWNARLRDLHVRSSGPVDRYYFRSLYFREPNGILFEIATDGPGFDVDEPLDQLGERLALPPFLESRRAEIESGLKPID